MMLDDLRNAASENMEAEKVAAEQEGRLKKQQKKRLSEKRVFGMTASQRFVLVLIILLMTCVLGVFFLILTDSVYLPFL